MNFALKILVIILIASPLTVNLSVAWNSGHDKTHEYIATTLYNDMPSNIKKNLELSEMKRGANYPDQTGEDKKYHAYRLSVNRTFDNLNKAMADYRNGNYKQESFHLGIATHYISDTFAAPHCIHRMENYHDYYKIADGITYMKGITLPQSVTQNLKTHKGLDTLLKYGYDEGKKDAQYWNDNQIWNDPKAAKSLATKNLKRAYAGTLAIIGKWLGFTTNPITANPLPPMRSMRAMRTMRT